MKNEMESRFLLSVYEKVKQNGVKQGLGYHLDGITAYTDHDGYTLFIEDALVKLRFGFHNQYTYDYEKAEHKEAFDKKLENINKAY
jgi:hypothetical protein